MPLTQEQLDKITQDLYGSGSLADETTGAGDWEWPISQDHPWWGTDRGKEFQSNIDSGEWDVGEGKDILNDMAENGTLYPEAVKRRGHGATLYRVWGDIKREVPEFIDIITKNPERIVTDFLDAVDQAKSGDPEQQNVYEGTKTRAFQALEEMVGNNATRVAIVPWVIAEGMVIGMAHAVWNLARGEAGAGDILDIATLALPVAKAATAARSMRGVARGVARSIGSGKVVKITKADLPKLMDDPDYGPALRAKVIEIARRNKLIGRVENATEAFNLVVQNNELMLELLGYTVQRIGTDAVARYKTPEGEIDSEVDVDVEADATGEAPVESEPADEIVDEEVAEEVAPDDPPVEPVEDEAVEDEAEPAPEEIADEVAEEATEDAVEEDAPIDVDQVLASITHNIEQFKSAVTDAIDAEADASPEQIEESVNNIRTFVAGIVDEETADALSLSEDARFQGKSLEEIQEAIADEHVADLESRVSDISGSKEAFDGIVESIVETANEQVHLPSEIDAFVDDQDIILEDDDGALINPTLANYPGYADLGADGLADSMRESARQRIGEIVKTPLAFRKMAPAAKDIKRVERSQSEKDGKSNHRYVYRNEDGRALASINVDQVSEDDIVVTVRTPGVQACCRQIRQRRPGRCHTVRSDTDCPDDGRATTARAGAMA